MVRAALNYIITLTLEAHPEISLDSYDRIIPNQGTLPKGGFGNLVALPLQFEARKLGNSCFVNVLSVCLDCSALFLKSLFVFCCAVFRIIAAYIVDIACVTV